MTNQKVNFQIEPLVEYNDSEWRNKNYGLIYVSAFLRYLQQSGYKMSPAGSYRAELRKIVEASPEERRKMVKIQNPTDAKSFEVVCGAIKRHKMLERTETRVWFDSGKRYFSLTPIQ